MKPTRATRRVLWLERRDAIYVAERCLHAALAVDATLTGLPALDLQDAFTGDGKPNPCLPARTQGIASVVLALSEWAEEMAPNNEPETDEVAA